MQSGHRYIFYEYSYYGVDDDTHIIDAEFIDIIGDTLRLRMFQYLNGDLFALGKINIGMLTMPYSWIKKWFKRCDDKDDDLKQFYLEI